MQSHEERADAMLQRLGGSLDLSMQRTVLRRLILAEDTVVDFQQAACVGPQPDEMTRLLEALDTAESVAQMAASDRDEALENFARVEQEYAAVQAERDKAQALAATLSEDWHRVTKASGRVRNALALIVGAFTNGVYCGSCGEPVDDCGCVIGNGRTALA